MIKKMFAVFKSRRRGIIFLLILVLMLDSSQASIGAPQKDDPFPFTTVELPPEAQTVDVSQFTALTSSKTAGLDSTLAQLADQAQRSLKPALSWAETQGLRILDERVLVQVAADPTRMEAALAAVAEAGGEVTSVGLNHTLAQCWVPVQALKTLAENPAIQMIRQPAELVLFEENAVPTAATIESLGPMNATAWHSAGYTGSGVKVAIIDGGFEDYPTLLGTDLPSSVTAKNFVDGESDADVDGGGPHGTACAEIVHDIAPDAALYLIKVSTNLDLDEAVSYAIAQGVDIISTSLGWYNLTPGDGTGEFADLVDTARSSNIFWATAASNDREAHWGGAYNDCGGTLVGSHCYGTQNVNFFGPGDGNAYKIPAGYAFRVFVRWDDWTNVDQDYDLILVKLVSGTWMQVGSSTDTQDGSAGQTPTEYAGIITSGGNAPYGFVIVRYSSTRDVNLEIFAPKIAELDELLYSRSLANLADAPDAVTVAALDVTAPYPQESYSSEGPTNGPGGTAAGGFTKPDIAGFANVSTESYGAGGFNGTSSATPHVAGAAALVLDGYPAYTPANIETHLTSNAIDMGSAGMDNVYGYGRLYLGTPPDLTDPSVSLTSPVGGETWQAGVSHDITWNATDNVGVDHVDLHYSTNGGSSWSDLALDETNDGAYSWTVPSIDTAAARVMITAYDAAGNFDIDNSANFTITTADITDPSVSLTSPTGGESWQAGASHNITWNATDNVGVDHVDLHYSTNGGSSWTDLALGETNDGAYSWTVPSIDTAAAQVRVTAYDAAGNFDIDNSANFTITDIIAIYLPMVVR